MVYQRTNPWTQEGRYLAIQKGVGEVYARYFARGPKWVAKHLPHRAEMKQYGSLVSAESREIILGDFGVESFIEDYALWATYASGKSISTGQIYTQWVSDENRHGKALWYCLVDSGLYTQAFVDEYLFECGQDSWSFERQTGHEGTPERAAAYAIAQERQTKRNYRNLQQRLWSEYGSPRDSDGRPAYPAIAGVTGVLAVDEGFHEGVFREITRVYLEFWPEKALQAMWDVYERYRMPIVKLPNAEVFIDAVLSTGVDSHRSVITDVLNPTYAAMGLQNRAAVKRAARESWDLPDGAILQVGHGVASGVPAGAIAYEMQPNGALTQVGARSVSPALA